jgi:hypothetical protein
MEAILRSALILRKEYARERGPTTWFNLQSIFFFFGVVKNIVRFKRLELKSLLHLGYRDLRHQKNGLID